MLIIHTALRPGVTYYCYYYYYDYDYDYYYYWQPWQPLVARVALRRPKTYYHPTTRRRLYLVGTRYHRGDATGKQVRLHSWQAGLDSLRPIP